MEQLSFTPLTMQNELLESEELLKHFRDCVEKAEGGEELSRESLKDCTSTIAAMLLYKSWWKLGAVVNVAGVPCQKNYKRCKGDHVKERKMVLQALQNDISVTLVMDILVLCVLCAWA